MMRRLWVMAAALVMTGCATQALHGNYLANADADKQRQLASDAVKQVVALWPPARTRLALNQPTDDVFGVALTQGLRDKGFGISEYGAPRETAPVVEQLVPLPEAITRTRTLNYMLDAAPNANLYRLVITVDATTLTRGYVAKAKGVWTPAGQWTRKEIAQ